MSSASGKYDNSAAAYLQADATGLYPDPDLARCFPWRFLWSGAEELNRGVRRGRVRGGSVCLNRYRSLVKWISALVMPQPGLIAAR